MNRICLVVLIGLPGAGKTTFCQHLMQMQFLPFNILHFCYDNLINFNSESSIHFKKQRENILTFLKETVVQLKKGVNLLEEPLTMNVHYKNHQCSDTIILCDDNNYYRSMRYKAFQIAREECIGYCQIYFSCKAQLATERNSLRNASQRIPNDIILQMCSRLESPNVVDHRWEKNTIILQSSNSWDYNYHEIIPFITRFLNDPVQPPQVPVSQLASTQSKVHELDLLLRKHLKICMTFNRNKNSIMAKELNDRRKEILEIFQKDVACGLQDMDINKYVERFSKN